MNPADQIEFARYGTTFAYNALPAFISASLAVNPGLWRRKIYAAVLQPTAVTAYGTFTLAFLLNGASVGSITQRFALAGADVPTDTSQFWTLGPNRGAGTVGEQALRRVPGALQVVANNSTSEGYPFEIDPIELCAAFDTINLTCSEWAGATSGQLGHIFLACLSTYDRLPS